MKADRLGITADAPRARGWRRRLAVALIAVAATLGPASAQDRDRLFVDALAREIVERYRELDRDFERCIHPDRSRWSLAFLGFVPNNPSVTATEARALTALVREAILEANLGFPLFAVEMNREIARLARTSVATEAFRRQLAEQEEATFVLAVHPMRPAADTVVLDINLLARNADGFYFCNRPITLAVHLPSRTVPDGFPPSGELYTLDGATARFLERYARFLVEDEAIGLVAESALVGDCDLATGVEAKVSTIYSEVADVLALEDLGERRLPFIDQAAGENRLVLRVALLSQRGDRVVRVSLDLSRGTRRIGADLFAAVVDPADLEGCDPAVAGLRESVATLSASRDALAAEVEGLRRAADGVRGEVRVAEQSLAAARAELERLGREREGAGRDLARLAADAEEAARRLADAKMELAAAEEARANARETIARLGREADARASREAARLATGTEEARRALAAVQAEVAAAQDRREAAREALARIEREAEEARRAAEAETETRERLRAEVAVLELTLRGLREEEKAARAAMARLSDDAQRAWTAAGAETRTAVRASVRECAECPEMIEIPAGSFFMGAQAGEDGSEADEGPQHRRDIARFAIGRTEVTVEEYRRFVAETGHGAAGPCWGQVYGVWDYHLQVTWQSPGYAQTPSHPAVCVSWEDARAYVDWLNGKVEGSPFRLPTEAEWEYAARAVTHGRPDTTPYFWGTRADDACAFANGADAAAREVFPGWTVFGCRDGQAFAAPTGSFAANAFGLVDTAGNAWEWVDDCWHESHEGAPGDGRARGSEGGGDCSGRPMRGGAWDGLPRNLRAAERLRAGVGDRSTLTGFRVARSLPPG